MSGKMKKKHFGNYVVSGGKQIFARRSLISYKKKLNTEFKPPMIRDAVKNVLADFAR